MWNLHLSRKTIEPNEMGVYVVTIDGLQPQDFENIPLVQEVSHASDMRT